MGACGADGNAKTVGGGGWRDLGETTLGETDDEPGRGTCTSGAVRCHAKAYNAAS